MKIGLHIADFTYPDGPSGLRDDLSRIVTTAEEAGFGRVSVMDHLWQIGFLGPPDLLSRGDDVRTLQQFVRHLSADSQGPIYSVWSRAVMNGVGTANSSAGSSTSESVNPVMEKRDALYHAFWCLVDDLRQLKPTPTE